MPRIRTVKPDHWNDKELPNISLPAHLMWIGMWNFSDDKGVIEADPLLIKSNVFPRRTDIRLKQIHLWLDQLVKARFIVPFKYANESYYVHRTFETHQRIDKPQPSKIPEQAIENALATLNSENVTGMIPPVLDSKVKESSGESSPPPVFLKKNGRREKKCTGPPGFKEVLEVFKTSMKDHWTPIKINQEAQKFFSHYEAMGWKIGGQKIEVWQAKANEWVVKEIQHS